MDVSDVRKAHKILDDLLKGNMVLDEEREFLRRALPELPKQKTLAELTHDVYDVWVDTTGNEWPDYAHGELETWLAELHTQLKGLETTAAPALPEGMRLADHEARGEWEIQYSEIDTHDGAGLGYVGADALSFLEASPIAKPAHPEFLGTEEDYRNAPNGTIAGVDKVGTAWIKTSDAWHSTDGDHSVECPDLSVGTRRVLRWGWGSD